MKYFFLLTIIFSYYASYSQNNEVYVLKYAILKDSSPVSNWVKGASDKDSVPISFHFWLIKCPDGKKVLVDAGCRMDLQNAVDFGLTDFERPDSVLQSIGVAASEISDIIISHPHWDHIDGLPLFPNATVWMQKKDYMHYVGEAWQGGKKPGGIAPRTIEYLLQLNMNGKLQLIDGDNKEVLKGITVYNGSRHTFDSQHIAVQSGNKKAVIAGDDIWIYQNLERMQPPPDFATMDAKGYVANMKRMKSLASNADYIMPGHDARLFKKFPAVNNRVIRVL